jgi:hypothetical protein
VWISAGAESMTNRRFEPVPCRSGLGALEAMMRIIFFLSFFASYGRTRG